MLQLSPGKTPARRREAGQLAGTAADGGNKDGPRPDAVMEKPIGAPGRARQGRGGARPAAPPPSPAGPGGAALGSRPGSASRGQRGETRENRECRAGRGGLGTENPKYPGSGGGVHPGSASTPPCSRPGLEGSRPGARRVHAGCTRPLGSCDSGWWPASRGRADTSPPPPGQGADACAAAHTPLYTHDHIHARAPRHASQPQLPGQREGKRPKKRGGLDASLAAPRAGDRTSGARGEDP